MKKKYIYERNDVRQVRFISDICVGRKILIENLFCKEEIEKYEEKILLKIYKNKKNVCLNGE